VSTPKLSTQNPADIARETFKQLSVSRTPPTPQAYKKFYNEIAGIVEEIDSNQTALLKDLLSRTVGLALPSLLISAPELSKEAEALSLLLKNADNKKDFSDIGTRLKNLCFRIEICLSSPNQLRLKENSPFQ
jgi:hypothetical protein